MVVAVTGHSGFIGKHLCKAIKDKGWTLIKIDKDYTPIQCDRIYHLACPSSTKAINDNPIKIINTIIDGTKLASNICKKAHFVNISSLGAEDTLINNQQGCYNTAKRLMELYLHHSNGISGTNYRLPSIYGDGMSDDSFIKRCMDGTAYKPTTPNKLHYIMQVNKLVQSIIELEPLEVEEITLGDIYEHFNSGRRGLHRPAPIT
jgi:nucleoside-diphosphate-sugar epimerase